MAVQSSEEKMTFVGELSSKALAFSVDALLSAEKKYPESTSHRDGETPGSRVQVELCSRELWRKFHRLGTEMIITKAGRRMFPTIKVILRGLEPHVSYIVFLDIVPKDEKRYRYVYHSSQWTIAGAGDPPLGPAIFIHPDSPAQGRLWMAQGVLAFDKLKLTNNRKPIVRGQVTLHSMHKYQPRVHILPTVDLTTPAMTQATDALKHGDLVTFAFPETVFTTVTAYQNQQITRLKIASNPFAKGFREATRKGELEIKERLPTSTPTIASPIEPLFPAFLSAPVTSCPVTSCALLRPLVSHHVISHPPLDLRRRQAR